MRSNRNRRPVGRGIVAGLLAAAVSLGVAELVSGLRRGTEGPIVSVGGWVIDHTPSAMKTFAIRTFGENDKRALIIGTVVLLAGFAAIVGVLALRRLRFGLAGVGLFGLIGAAAAVTRPQATLEDASASLIGAAAGMAAMTLLLRSGSPELPASAGDGSTGADSTGTGADRAQLAPEALRVGEPALARRLMPHGSHVGEPTPGTNTADIGGGDQTGGTDRTGRVGRVGRLDGVGRVGRRRFLGTAAGFGVLAAVSGAAGKVLRKRFDVRLARQDVTLPKPASAALPVPANIEVGVPGVGPFFTPNADFYRVDTTLSTPQVDPNSWRLTVGGMVNKPLTLTYQDLLDQPLVERDITLVCVSNEVGGNYVGTARWLGVPLASILKQAGVSPGATQLVSRSVDGWTAGSPVADILDGRDALVAVGMNGEVLPIAHGFPARLVIPGLYGFVSATKWVTDLELTTFEAYDPYWAKRGWAKKAPIKTMARIDTPRGLSRTKAGPIMVGGVAWAIHRGITKVEIRVDDGPWQDAKLANGPSADTWRQWSFAWDATPGNHTLTCRATDGTGQLQTDQRAQPIPDGASGWHTIVALID